MTIIVILSVTVIVILVSVLSTPFTLNDDILFPDVGVAVIVIDVPYGILDPFVYVVPDELFTITVAPLSVVIESR